MEKVLIAYLLLSNICAIIWVCKNQNMLNIKDLHVLRRYLISITVGPFVVIPFWISQYRSSIIKRRGEKLANDGDRLAKWIKTDSEVHGDDHIDLYRNLTDNFNSKFKSFNIISKKHINFQEKYLKRMAKWLGRNYI